MLIAHLSDLHLRDTGDVVWLERQLDLIVARHPAHLAVTGDLLDRWDPQLLAVAMDSFEARGLLDADRMTLIHGNHDLASSGGHPRRGRDLWRLALRFWDPPPVVARRRREFLGILHRRAPGVAAAAASVKTISAGARVAVIDTVPTPWRPIRYSRGSVNVRHAVGCARVSECNWLAEQAGPNPLILLAHHYPLETPPFRWTPDRQELGGLWKVGLGRLVREVCVPMEIPPPDRERFWHAAADARVRLVLCGHVHRTRLEWRHGIAVGLNGQSGAAWAGRTIAFYEVDATVRMETVRIGDRSELTGVPSTPTASRSS